MIYKFPPEPFTTTQWLQMNEWGKTASHHSRATQLLKSHGYEFKLFPVGLGRRPAKQWRRKQSTEDGDKR